MKFQVSLLLIVVLLNSMHMAAQNKIYQIRADSVRIFSSCDTAELVLENRTRNLLNGVLSNKGNGVTEFKKVLQRLNDTLYSIGGDTLNAAVFGKNIYNGNGLINSDRVVDGDNRNVQFKNNGSFVVANKARPVIISRTAMDSTSMAIVNNSAVTPFTGLVVRGTGCDATIELVSDSAGTCNETQQIDFMTLRPRKDSWLSTLGDITPTLDKFLLGRIQLQTRPQYPDYSQMNFGIKSDTAFYSDGSYVLYSAGTAGGSFPYPIMSINPSYKNVQGYNTKMPYVLVNGGMFVGYGRNWYFNSRNAKDIIAGVDDVAGYLQPFYETRFSVYADSLPLKIFKLPSLKGSAFLTYSPGRTVDGNNVAFEYKDSVYEDIRNYVSARGLTTLSDLNLKEHITATTFDGEKLLRIPVKDFNYKADKNKTRYTGLIAQDLKSLLPELVNGPEGHSGIDYTKMVPYLLKILQDQQKEIADLKLETARMNNRPPVPDLESMVNQLRQQLQQQQHSIDMLQEQVKNN